MLPIALLALLFASPVFADFTPYDPFRALVLQKPKLPENPICCLKPVTTSEPVDDGILLSFDEWKIKQQLANQPEIVPGPNEASTGNGLLASGEGQVAHDVGGGSESLPQSDSPSGSQNTAQVLSGPHFRVPLTDRFNYASLDCSARVHTSHRSAKSPASILSSKRDRYMLSPCEKSKEKHFVVVELCDDIRIDTVQLANFEFFSGVFKDFTVSVTKTYTTDPDAWTLVSSYRAKNTRGVQSFHPPTSLRDFYRFIRIDFFSNYGNEFYCPVSLLRVYGLTHLEEWKWDIWESESRSKQAELLQKRQHPLTVEIISDVPITSLPPDSISNSGRGDEASSESPRITPTDIPRSGNTSPSSQKASSTTSPDLKISELSTAIATSNHDTPTPTPNETKPKTASHTTADTLIYHSTDTSVSSRSLSSIPPPSPSESQHKESKSNIPTASSCVESIFTSSKASISSPTPATATGSIDVSSPIPSPSNASQSQVIPGGGGGTANIIISPASPSVAVNVIPIIPPPLPLATKGGESIYRTIMNRLAEVELNQTLYTRYIEQQNLAVREVIKRLGEDVGRLEGISRAQSVTYQRTMNEWEKQRYQLEMEYGDLISRIEHLSEEIVLEKRLGVAQLCLLLAVLIFLGLTRGSRAEALVDHVHGPPNIFNPSFKEWGKRQFRLSSDWAGRFKGKNTNANTRGRTSRSQSRGRSSSSDDVPRTPPQTSRPKPKSNKSYPPHLPLSFQSDDNSLVFPATSRPYRDRPKPLETIQLNTAPILQDSQSRNRPRTISNPRSRAPSLRSTPTGRRGQYHPRPITPTTAGASFRAQLQQQDQLNPIQRSNSHGVGASTSQSSLWGPSIPKSAKRWARTAHLHEVKSAHPLLPPASAGRRAKKSGEDTGHVVLDDGKMPREFGFEKENISLAKASTSSSGLEKSAVMADVPVSSVGMDGQPHPLPVNSLLFKAESQDDGDPWVDTDSFDGSELDQSSPKDDTVKLPLPIPVPFPS